MRSYAYQRKDAPAISRRPVKALVKPETAQAPMPNQAPSLFLLAKEAVEAKVSPLLGFSSIAFLATAVGSMAILAQVEMVSSVYDPVLPNRSLVRPSAGQEAVMGEFVAGFQAGTPLRLTSAENSSLELIVTPIAFSGGRWLYEVSWQRALSKEGSLVITRKDDRSQRLMALDQAAQAGRENVYLLPENRYRLEFFSQSDGTGEILLRKYFSTPSSFSR